MVDDERFYDVEAVEPDEDQEPPEKERQSADRRSLALVLTTAIVIIIIVLVILLLRGCGSLVNTDSSGGNGRQIVPVTGHAPVEGEVSVWIAAGSDPDQVLAKAGVGHQGIVATGGGRYVVHVPAGDEIDAVRRLKKVEAVYDAGRVYKAD